MRKLLLLVSLLLIGFGVYMFVATLFWQQGLVPFTSILCPAGSTIANDSYNWSLPNGESGTNINFYCADAAGTQTPMDDGPLVLLMAGPFVAGILLISIGLPLMMRRSFSAAAADDLYGIGAQPVLRQGVTINSGTGALDRNAVLAEVRQALEQAGAAGGNPGVHVDWSGMNSSDHAAALQQALDSGQITQAQFDKVQKALDEFARTGNVSGGKVVWSSSTTTSGGGGEDLAQKLESLQKALDAGLITQEEFDKKRQQIIDNY